MEIARTEKGSPVRSQEELTQLAFYSVLAGATALIPLPVVDDWAYLAVRRRMWFHLLRRKGLRVEQRELARVLSGLPDYRSRGCAYRILFFTLWVPLRFIGYLLRGIMRKVLFFLALKQASDRASETFHEGYLLSYAASTRRGEGEAFLARLQSRIKRVLEGLNMSPVWSIFYSLLGMNRKLLREISRRLTRSGRIKRTDLESTCGDSLSEERSLLDSFIHRLADLLAGQEGYLGALEVRFDTGGTIRGE